jgi:hypothetical protein
MFKINNIYKSSVLFAAIIGLSGCVVSKEHSSVSTREKSNYYCEIKNFTAKYNNGKIYINWVVNTNISNIYFILEKTNESGHSVVCVKKGFTSPTAEGLSYSFTDEKLKNSSRTYKLRAVKPVKEGEELLLYAESKNLFEGSEKAILTVNNDENTTVSK